MSCYHCCDNFFFLIQPVIYNYKIEEYGAFCGLCFYDPKYAFWSLAFIKNCFTTSFILSTYTQFEIITFYLKHEWTFVTSLSRR